MKYWWLILVFVGGLVCAQDYTQNAYENIYDQVLQADAEQAVVSCQALQATLDKGAKQRLAGFTQLVSAWAKVDANFILADYQTEVADYPILIDYFHVGKEDIVQSMQRIIGTSMPAGQALYKNSYQSLRALDVVMFSGQWSKRRAELAQAILHRACGRITAVLKAYQQSRVAFLANTHQALSVLVNASLNVIYKTRDQRIGQVSGLTKKTLGQFLPGDQQYPYSKASWAVIGADLNALQAIWSSATAPNLSTVVAAKKADRYLSALEKAMTATLTAYHRIPDTKAFDTESVIPIFQGLKDMQNAIYGLVIGIGVTPQIIDADGD